MALEQGLQSSDERVYQLIAVEIEKFLHTLFKKTLEIE